MKQGLSQETTAPVNTAQVQAAIERHQAALLRYTTRLIGGDTAKAAEAVHGAFAELKALPPEDTIENTAEWLFATCRRRAMDVLRREGRITRFESGGGQAAGAEAGAAGETEEPHVTMQRLIARLTPKQQEVVRLRFQNGFSHKEIARITELTPFNVGVLVHHAVARLGREFGDQHPELAPAERPAGQPDDPRLTAFALGELDEGERKAFEKSLLDRKTANARVEEIRAISTQIGQTLAIEAGAPAPRTVRKKSKRPPAAGWRGFPRVLVLLAAVVLLLGGGAFWWLRSTNESPAVVADQPDFRLKAADWKELPAAEGETAGKVSGAGSAPLTGNAAGRRASSSPGNVRSDVRVAPAAPPGTHANEEATGREETARSSGEKPPPRGGSPVEAVPTGVSAINRGRSGEISPASKSAEAGGVTGDVAPEVWRPEQGSEAAVPVTQEPEAAARPAGLSPPKPRRASGAIKSGDSLERKFETAKAAPASPLPVEAGTASVAALKRALAGGQPPPRAAVRIEQLLNYFSPPVAPPAGPALFAAELEVAEAPWAPTHRLVRIGLRARDVPAPPRAPATLVLLLDVSGSMVPPNRLPLVQEALRLVLERLQPDDRVGLVTYAGESRLTLAPTPLTERKKIRAALDALEARGLTNGGAGLELAYDLAKANFAAGGVNAVVLCTDGDFNVGATSEAELGRLVDRQADSRVTLSIFGFGRGSRIDGRLEALAKRGGGQSGYVNTRREAERVLVAQIGGQLEPLASDVRLEAAFNPAQVESYRLLGYEDETALADSSAEAGATVGPGHTLTALYEVVPAAGADRENEDLLTLKIDYRDARTGGPGRQQFALKDAGKAFEDASADFKFAAAVAAFGQILRDSPAKGSATLEQVAEWARQGATDDSGGYRTEFLEMVAAARTLAQ
jgi:Ca-activated chloride channel family protein